MTLGDVISEYRKETGLSMERFASIAGISKGYVSMLERNRTQRGDEPTPSIETYRNIAKALGLSVDELIRKVDGKVSFDVSQSTAPSLPSNALPFVPDELVTYNVIGSIAAGYGSEALEEYTGEVQSLPRSSLRGRSPEDFFVLRVKGNSMYPQFLEGDHVLVLRCDVVNSGSVAVVLYNGDEATLKKVYYGSGYLDLVPINPEYQARRIEGADLSKCRILGRVASLLRDFE